MWILIFQVIAAGSKKLATVSFGKKEYWILCINSLKGGSSGAAPANTAAPAKVEAKKEEAKPKEEEAADVGLGGGLFGDDEEW